MSGCFEGEKGRDEGRLAWLWHCRAFGIHAVELCAFESASERVEPKYSRWLRRLPRGDNFQLCKDYRERMSGHSENRRKGTGVLVVVT